LLFTFGEKPSEKPVTARKSKTNGNAKGKGESATGAIYGIPRTIIEAKARTGESYENAALRLLEEARTKRTSDISEEV
jgi:hypothetical protein